MSANLSETGFGRAVGRRGGYAAVIAMVFLVIGTTLVAGLYAMVSSATAITANEQRAAQSLGAAETGMEFMRHQLGAAARSATFSGIDASNWVGPLATALSGSMNGTATLGGKIVAAPVSFILTVPSISLGDGTSFSALVQPTSDNRRLSLVVTGYSKDGLRRRLEVDFSGPPAGPVVFPLEARGGIVSATNVNPTGSKGESYQSASVALAGGGTGSVLLYDGMTKPSPTMNFPDNSALIQAVAGAGLKPITDLSTKTVQTTTVAAVYDKKGNVVTPAQSVATVLAQNSCVIPPNSSAAVCTLSGTINGIVYVQWPNAVTIGDSLVLNGTIVFERQNGKAGTSTLDVTRSSVIDRSMNAATTVLQQFTFTGADQLKWWSIIAPDVNLTMHNGTTWGTTKAFEGSLNINSFSREGGGNQVALNITMGGIVAEGTISMSSNGSMYAINPDTSLASGAAGGRLSLVAASYQELLR